MMYNALSLVRAERCSPVSDGCPFAARCRRLRSENGTAGKFASCRSRFSEIDARRDLQGIINIDAEVSHRALKLGVSEQELDSPQVAGVAVNEGGLGAPQGVRAIGCRVQPDRRHPALNDASGLPGREMRRGFQPALEEIIVSTRHPAFEQRRYRSAGVLRDLELHGPAGLLLDDHAACLHVSASRHIANLQPDRSSTRSGQSKAGWARHTSSQRPSQRSKQR
jgi:hypothetical protein